MLKTLHDYSYALDSQGLFSFCKSAKETQSLVQYQKPHSSRSKSDIILIKNHPMHLFDKN